RLLLHAPQFPLVIHSRSTPPVSDAGLLLPLRRQRATPRSSPPSAARVLRQSLTRVLVANRASKAARGRSASNRAGLHFGALCATRLGTNCQNSFDRLISSIDKTTYQEPSRRLQPAAQRLLIRTR